jgi:hypothetical protein
VPTESTSKEKVAGNFEKKSSNKLVHKTTLFGLEDAGHCDFSFQPVLPDGTFIFKPKIPNWVNLGGSCNDIFYGKLVHFKDI